MEARISSHYFAGPSGRGPAAPSPTHCATKLPKSHLLSSLSRTERTLWLQKEYIHNDIAPVLTTSTSTIPQRRSHASSIGPPLRPLSAFQLCSPPIPHNLHPHHHSRSPPSPSTTASALSAHSPNSTNENSPAQQYHSSAQSPSSHHDRRTAAARGCTEVYERSTATGGACLASGPNELLLAAAASEDAEGPTGGLSAYQPTSRLPPAPSGPVLVDLGEGFIVAVNPNALHGGSSNHHGHHAMCGMPLAHAAAATAAPPGPTPTNMSHHQQAKQLTRALRSTLSWRELRQLLVAGGPSLDAIHLATTARRLREVAPPAGRRMARERFKFRAFAAGFTELCGYYLPTMPPVPLVAVLYCMAAIRCPPPSPWVAAWLAAAGRVVPRFGPRELANSLYALGQLEYGPGQVWMRSACDRAMHFMGAGGAEGGGAAGTVVAEDEVEVSTATASVAVTTNQRIASQGDGTNPWVSAVADASSDGGDDRIDGTGAFTAQGLSQVFWGLARVRHLPGQGFMTTLCSETLLQLPYFTGQGLSNVLWALGSMRYRPPDPWVSAVAAACCRLLPTGNSYDLSVSLWALLRMGFEPGSEWMAAFLEASYRQLSTATPEHAARMLWCLAKVRLTPPQIWIRRWLSLSYVGLLEAKPVSLTSMLWALVTLGIRPGSKWLEMLQMAAWERPLRAFTPPDLSMLMWGLAQCRALPEAAWMDEFWLVSYRRLRVTPPRHLSLLLWSCVTLGQAPSPQWLAGYETVTLASMDQLSPEGLSLIIYSYGILEQTPPRAWLLSAYDTCVRRDFEGFNALALERLIWGIAACGPSEDAAPDVVPGWTTAFLERCVIQLHDATYCNLANMLYGLATLGVRPSDDWLTAVVGRMEVLVGDFGSTTSRKVAWALPLLVADREPLVKQHASRVLELLAAQEALREAVRSGTQRGARRGGPSGESTGSSRYGSEQRRR